MIVFWALRLGSYLFYRINKLGKDVRFDKIRTDFKKFFMFWVFQGISVFIISVNAIVLFSKENLTFNYLSVIGVLLWTVGLSIEAIADIQKFKFKQKNIKTWTNIGLWKYSRHPNYFGEMLCWVGVFVYSLFYLNLTNVLYSIVSPLFIIFLLLFVSGVPTIEKKYDNKFKDNKDYQKYKQKTNLLLPIKVK